MEQENPLLEEVQGLPFVKEVRTTEQFNTPEQTLRIVEKFYKNENDRKLFGVFEEYINSPSIFFNQEEKSEMARQAVYTKLKRKSPEVYKLLMTNNLRRERMYQVIYAYRTFNKKLNIEFAEDAIKNVEKRIKEYENVPESERPAEKVELAEILTNVCRKILLQNMGEVSL